MKPRGPYRVSKETGWIDTYYVIDRDDQLAVYAVDPGVAKRIVCYHCASQCIRHRKASGPHD